jgi:hypothetical protein
MRHPNRERCLEQGSAKLSSQERPSQQRRLHCHSQE